MKSNTCVSKDENEYGYQLRVAAEKLGLALIAQAELKIQAYGHGN